jgi:AraC-like DNA-binding protein
MMLSYHLMMLMLEDLKINSNCGGFAFRGYGRSLPRLVSHRHIELELNIVVQGSITYVVDGSRFRFGKRSLLWLFPSQEHQLVDRSADAQYYVAVFKPSLIEGVCSAPEYSTLKKESCATSLGDVASAKLPPDAFDLACRMLDALQEDGPPADVLIREAGYGYRSDFHYWHNDPDRLNAGLQYLLLYCWRLQRLSQGVAPSIRLHPAVHKALSILGDEPETIDMPDLARRCGVSEAHLSRTFTRQVGTPISNYRNALRLRRFWDAYHAPSAPSMTEAAYTAGFGSYAQFYKVFARAYGRGPRELLGAEA